MFAWLTNLRGRLIIVLLLVAAPLFVLTLRAGLVQREQNAEAVQSDALRLARVAALNQEFLLEQTKGFLLALAHTVGTDVNTFGNCQKVFSHLSTTHFPYYTGFYVADLDGNLLCLTPGEVPKIDVCAHYAELIQSRDFVISDYHLCKNTGKGVISVGYPVIGDNDEAIGVVNVGIDLEWFNQLAEDADLPPGSHLVVFNDERTILTHYPDPRIWVGDVMPNDPLTQYMLEQEEGSTQGISFDGIHRLYAFVPLWSGDRTVILAVGIPTDVAYQPVNRATWFNLGMIAFVTVAAVAVAWFMGDSRFVQPIQAIVNTTKRLAAGDLNARTQLEQEPGEIGVLARAVDQMAEALIEHEAERDRNEKAIQEYAQNLEMTNRELQDFNSIASHDLQEPVRKLQVFSDLLLARYGQVLDENGRRYLNSLNQGAGRMQRLIQDLLAYSQLTTRARPFSEVDLDEVLRDVLIDLEAQVYQSEARIERGPLPVIEAEPSQMHRLLLNLLNNALKFRRPEVRPHIKVYAEPLNGPSSPGENQVVKICIEDNGIGFEEKYLDRIFQPFESLHKRDEYPGTGMGLAICRKIVERHGGQITAHSKPDHGSMFVVTFPVHQPIGGTDNGAKNSDHSAG